MRRKENAERDSDQRNTHKSLTGNSEHSQPILGRGSAEVLDSRSNQSDSSKASDRHPEEVRYVTAHVSEVGYWPPFGIGDSFIDEVSKDMASALDAVLRGTEFAMFSCSNSTDAHARFCEDLKKRYPQSKVQTITIPEQDAKTKVR